MKHFFGILLIFVVIYIFYLPTVYLKYIREEEYEFSGYLLSKALDYAGETALHNSFNIINLEMSYDESDNMIISPDGIAETFAQMLCLSYGLPPSKYNLDSIINKIPVMILAVNNGYYIAEWQETEDGMELMWKPKTAYTIDMNPGSPNAGICYSVELNMNKVHIVNKSTLSVNTLDNYSELPFDREVILQNINRNINKDVNAVLARYAIEQNKQSIQSFYLPVSDGSSGVQRIEQPGLIIVLRDIDIDGIHPRNITSINGMRVHEKINHIIGWTDDNGNKFYSLDGNVSHEILLSIEQNGEIFASIQEAADKSYLPFYLI